MNSQNILKFFGGKFDLTLDSSEYYDYEIHNIDSDYDELVLDLSNTISYDTLKITTTGLTNTTPAKRFITLLEYDNTVNDTNYQYSAFTWTIPYTAFTLTLNNSDIILDNDVYEFIDRNNQTHYFTISGYSAPFASNPFSLDLSGFTSTTGSSYACVQKLSGSTLCCPQDPIYDSKPWAYQINHGSGTDNCSYVVDRRTEKGWTIDLVLNRNGYPWSLGNTIYYLGVRGESDPKNYADNNLSFSFTDDGRVQWKSIHYSGICSTDSGYTETYYVSSGQTQQLCQNGTSEDFNLTFTFDRNRYYTDCKIENDGGWNDLITGRTMTSSIYSWLTGGTATYDEIETLNKKWFEERRNRLGTLKIFLNGREIYKLNDWEEIIPSKRGKQPMIQSWGLGTEYSGGIHNMGPSWFNFKKINYYEEPLNYSRIRHHYLVDIKPNYNIVECNDDCIDNVIGIIHTITPTPTPSITPFFTPPVSVTPSVTITPSISVTPTMSVTPSVTPYISVTPSITPSVTPSTSITPSVTPSITPSETPSVTPSMSITPSMSVTPSVTPSITPSETPSMSVTPSITPSETPSMSVTPSVTPSITPSETPSITPSETPSITPSITPSTSIIPFVGFLDTYTGASYAFSLRQLSSTYNGPIVRLRESAYGAEGDVSFSNNQIEFTSNVTITNIGTGSPWSLNQVITLSAFTGSNSAFVVTWYDQSGNNNHVSQSGSTAQPVLISGGSFNTVTGTGSTRPTINFNGTTHFLSRSTGILNLVNASTGSCVLVVNRMLSLTGGIVMADTTNASNSRYSFGVLNSGGFSSFTYRSSLATSNVILNRNANGNTNLNLSVSTVSPFSGTDFSPLTSFHQNSVIQTLTGSSQVPTAASTIGFVLGRNTTAVNFINCSLSEIIGYQQTTSSTTRSNMELSINNYYNIF